MRVKIQNIQLIKYYINVNKYFQNLAKKVLARIQYETKM